MNIDNIKQVFLVGIGGIGMSALARYFRHLGCTVAGYDKTETKLTRNLVGEGISVFYHDDFSLVREEFRVADEHTLLIYTPAVPADLSILHEFRLAGHMLFKRSEVLGLISRDRYTIAVAGTHGKTTTSTMIAHLLTASGYGCSAFLGGISTNYNTNVLFADNDTVVVEADEFDRSFLTLYPDIAVVTSADADHLDVYGDKGQLEESFELFLQQLQPGGKRIIRAGLPFASDMSYSAYQSAEACAERIQIIEGEYYFDYVQGEERISDIRLGIPGRHNIENAVAAIAVARLLGVPDEAIAAALASFAGVKRRYEVVVSNARHTYIDDYAHHPEELRAFLSSVKERYPDKHLTVVFQPHLFTRTRDFADDFAKVLGLSDTLILMPIYPARELPLPGITSEWLAGNVVADEKHVLDADGVKEFVAVRKPELLVTVGAGNIDLLVEPLQEVLSNG